MRELKLTRVQPNPTPIYGDSVVMPPKDDYWIDQRRTYLSLPGYPETSLMARPDYVPANAPHLVEEDQLPFTHDPYSESYPQSRSPAITADSLLCLIVCILFLNLILLLLILLKR